MSAIQSLVGRVEAALQPKVLTLQSASIPRQVTAITHQIPWFLRDPAVALIGEKCYTSLVYDFDLSNTECLKYALSKGLGLGIVLGGSIVKVPQIIKIVQTRSARGLSLPAYILETAAYAISLSYSARLKFPFSTYGENFFLTLQNIVITILIIYHAPSKAAHKPLSGPGGNLRLAGGAAGGNLSGALVGAVVAIIGGVALWSETITPPHIMSFLQTATLPLSLLSKAPQILSNHRLRSTGNLSAFAVFNALLGCLARLFTTSQETGDRVLWWGFALAGGLNAVLVAQMIAYWGSDGKAGAKAGDGGRSLPGSPMREETFEKKLD